MRLCEIDYNDPEVDDKYCWDVSYDGRVAWLMDTELEVCIFRMLVDSNIKPYKILNGLQEGVSVSEQYGRLSPSERILWNCVRLDL